MEIEPLAEFIGAHALVTLLLLAALMLGVTALLWHLLHRHGVAIQRTAMQIASAIRDRLAPHTHRLPSAVPRAWHILRRIGIQALLSLAVSIAAITAFVEIADEIGADEDLARFDEALSASLNRHASPALLRSFATIAHLGDKEFLIPLCAIIGAILLWRRRWMLGSAWIVATGLGGLLIPLLKNLFERSRPEHTHGFAVADGWSFPSGHASGSFIVYGLLGYLLVISTPQKWHVPAAMLAVSLVVFVGFSRVILQVHFLSDVLAGYAFAAAWVAMWIAGLEAITRRLPPGPAPRGPS